MSFCFGKIENQSWWIKISNAKEGHDYNTINNIGIIVPERNKSRSSDIIIHHATLLVCTDRLYIPGRCVYQAEGSTLERNLPWKFPTGRTDRLFMKNWKTKIVWVLPIGRHSTFALLWSSGAYTQYRIHDSKPPFWPVNFNWSVEKATTAYQCIPISARRVSQALLGTPTVARLASRKDTSGRRTT